jgi:hypothetical protein
MAGPASDQRLSVRPDSSPGYYLNFALTPNALGAASEGNVHLAILVTYYDDPALAGQAFRPEVWSILQAGLLGQAHMSSAYNIVLQGTDKWRDAYWEIGAITFDGINQHPAAARFSCGAPIHISRVRYAVVRPCGPTSGQNELSNRVLLNAAPDTNGLVKLSWPYRAPQAVVQGVPVLGSTAWSTVAGTPTVESGTNSVFRLTPPSATQFFRLGLTPQ